MDRGRKFVKRCVTLNPYKIQILKIILPTLEGWCDPCGEGREEERGNREEMRHTTTLKQIKFSSFLESHFLKQLTIIFLIVKLPPKTTLPEGGKRSIHFTNRS